MKIKRFVVKMAVIRHFKLNVTPKKPFEYSSVVQDVVYSKDPIRHPYNWLVEEDLWFSEAQDTFIGALKP